MLPPHGLDDAAIQALLTGKAPAAPELAPLAGAVREIRAAGTRPVAASEELAARMASGDFTGVQPAPAPNAQPAGGRLRAWLAGSSPRARAVAGAAVLFTGLTAATAAGALPDGAQARVESLIESVTPISFDHEPGPAVVDIGDELPSRGESDRDAAEQTENDRPGSTTPPGKPDTPPGKPEDPGNPVKPERPETPVTPENPGKPETPPGKPDDPGNPDTPPDKPEAPPGKPDTPPGKPEDPPGKPDTPPDNAQRPEQTSKPEKPDPPEEPPGKPSDDDQQGSGQENRPTGPKR